MVKPDRRKKLGSKMVESSILPAQNFRPKEQEVVVAEKEMNGNCHHPTNGISPNPPVHLNGTLPNGAHHKKREHQQRNGRNNSSFSSNSSHYRQTQRRRSISKGSETSNASNHSSIQGGGGGKGRVEEKPKEVRLDLESPPPPLPIVVSSPSPVVEVAESVSSVLSLDSQSEQGEHTPTSDYTSPLTNRSHRGSESAHSSADMNVDSLTPPPPPINSTLTPSPGLETRLSDATTQSCDSVLSDPSPSCSKCVVRDLNDTQTQTEALHSDGLLGFISLSPWDQMETMCQMVTCLDPFSLRLLGTCVEGTARVHSSSLKNTELRANTPDFIKTLLTGTHFTQYPYLHTIETVYTMIALLYGTSRREACSFFEVIQRLHDTKLPEELKKFGDGEIEQKIEVIEKTGRLISVALYHPAFTIEHRTKLGTMRDALWSERERLLCSKPAPSASTSERMVYIKRFIADRFVDDTLPIELEWSDGVHSYTGRTKAQLLELHYHLLDVFGSEKKNDVTQKDMRVLPYLDVQEEDDENLAAYVCSLSDLPARIILSDVVFDEFYSTRQTSDDIISGPLKHSEPPSSWTPPQEEANPVRQPMHQAQSTYLPVFGLPPMMYPQFCNFQLPLVVQYANPPSCSNCGGQHNYADCTEKETYLNKLPGDDYRIKVRGTDVAPSPSPSMTMVGGEETNGYMNGMGAPRDPHPVMGLPPGLSLPNGIIPHSTAPIYATPPPAPVYNVNVNGGGMGYNNRQQGGGGYQHYSRRADRGGEGRRYSPADGSSSYRNGNGGDQGTKGHHGGGGSGPRGANMNMSNGHL